MVEEIMLNEEDGLERFENWRNINELAPSTEVTGEAGDFVLMHHMMPHGASRNKQIKNKGESNGPHKGAKVIACQHTNNRF